MISRPVMREFERSYMITACFTADIQDRYRSAVYLPVVAAVVFSIIHTTSILYGGTDLDEA